MQSFTEFRSDVFLHLLASNDVYTISWKNVRSRAHQYAQSVGTFIFNKSTIFHSEDRCQNEIAVYYARAFFIPYKD